MASLAIARTDYTPCSQYYKGSNNSLHVSDVESVCFNLEIEPSQLHFFVVLEVP